MYVKLFRNKNNTSIYVSTLYDHCREITYLTFTVYKRSVYERKQTYCQQFWVGDAGITNTTWSGCLVAYVCDISSYIVAWQMKFRQNLYGWYPSIYNGISYTNNSYTPFFSEKHISIYILV
jgi:hypothetical protein